MARALWACVTFLSTLMVVVAARRILYLSSPAMGLDGGFAVHALLTLSHVASGIVFILLGPFQFMAGLRRRRPTLHRWIGRVFLVDSVFVGVTALVMGPLMAIGGVLETAATLFFGLLFLFALVRGFSCDPRAPRRRAPEMDDPRLRDRPRCRDRPPHRWRLLRHQPHHPPHPSGFLWNRLLARLYAQHRSRRAVDPHTDGAAQLRVGKRQVNPTP